MKKARRLFEMIVTRIGEVVEVTIEEVHNRLQMH